MHKYRNPNQAPLFRGGERMRLMATIGSMAVLGMLIFRARDPDTWKWFAGVDEPLSPSVLEARDRELGRPAPQAKADRPVNPPRHFVVTPAPPSVAPQPLNAAALDAPALDAAPAEGADGMLALIDDSPPASSEAPTAAPSQPSDAPSSPAASALAKADNAAGLVDDVPPPDATPDPTLADKSGPSPVASGGVQNQPSGAARDPANMPDAALDGASPASSGASPKATYNAADPNAAGLADDVPPPEATPPDTTEFPSSVEGRAAENAPAAKIEETPIDQDLIERNQFNEDAQAITDKKELRVEEMAALWRLVDWEMAQKFSQMEKRARNDLMYAHFFKDPENYRGELVRLKLRIDRTLATDAEDNGKARGLARTYQAWGVTDESSPNHYVVMLTELPADFPLRNDMQEDVTFVGYFFKLMAYQSRDDKFRAAPLLIGKVFWHENPSVALPINPNWVFAGVAGIIAIVMLIVRLSFKMQPLRPRAILPPLRDGDESVPIESWLERIEEATPGAAPPSNRLAVNGHGDRDLPTNGTSRHHPEMFTEDPEP